jgi:hypothetical protein
MIVRDRFVAWRKAHPLGQFGQPHSVATFNGKTACGPTSVQSIIGAVRGGPLPTLDAICRTIGYYRPKSKVGTTAEQLAKALGHWRLSYRARYGASLSELRSASHQGPVVIVVDYPTYPNWQRYGGTARPTPWAKPWGKAGANQFPKPRIKHWVVLAGGALTEGPYKGLLAVMEPNHRSASRPQKVAIDYVSPASLEAAYNAGGKIAVVPTRSVA